MDVDRRAAGAAGAVAAGAALATGELVTGFDSAGTGLVSAVGDEFIDRFAGTLKDVAIALFGTNDKAALVVGIVAVSLALGAGLGIASVRRPLAGRVGFAAFAVLGAWAYARVPAASDALGVAAAALAAVAGTVTLAGLLWLARGAPAVPAPRLSTGPSVGAGARPAPVAGDPRVRVADRRQFLVAAGAIGAGAAGTAALGGRLRRGSAGGGALPPLPEPVASTAVPAAADLAIDGLAPYVTPTESFFRIDTALVVPRVDVGTWSVEVRGRVEEPFRLTYEELLGLPSVEVPATLQCVSNEVGGRLVGTAVWQGVDLRTLLDRAGLQAGGTQVVGRSVDGFTAGFPTSVLDDDRVALVAYAMNGEALTPTHGFPARLVVAGLYGYVSATKWLSAVELTGLDELDGYWIPRGWSKDGPIKVASRIDVPRSGERVAAGPSVVAGLAWAPTRGIAAVEVRVDDGPWLPATLAAVANDQTWVQWSLPWEAEPGEHVLRARATTVDGEVQTEAVAPPAPDGATGHHARRVVVG